jgi:hypothetical protein
MKALITVNKELINVVGRDAEELLMRLKDEIINRLDDEMDEIMEEIESGDSENCIVELESKHSRLQREYDRVMSRDDISGLRHMGYSIQEGMDIAKLERLRSIDVNIDPFSQNY